MRLKRRLAVAMVAACLPAGFAAASVAPSLYPGQVLPNSGIDSGVAQPPGLNQMVSADFNGDGNPDLAITDGAYAEFDSSTQIAGGVWVYLGKTGGGYAAPVLYPTGDEPGGIAAADLDGDGKLDLVTGNIGMSSGGGPYTNTDQLSVLLGNGDGSFQPMANYSPIQGTTTSSIWGGLVAVGDVTGGGHADVVLTTDDGEIFVVPVESDGTLDIAGEQTLTQAANFASLLALALADINGDGTLDVVSEDGSNVNVFYGQATLSTTPDQQLPLSISSPNVAAGDFNEDGRTDIAVTDALGTRHLYILLNQGGTLADSGATFTFPDEVSPWGTISVADIDGDSHVDLLLDDNSCDGDSSYILYGRGDGTFADPAPVPAGVCGGATATVDAGGGLRNLLTGTWPGNSGFVSEARNLGDRKFYTYASYPYASVDAGGTVQGTQNYDTAVADFNGDGALDLVSANNGDTSFSLLLNDGHGGFEAPSIQPVGVSGNPYAIAAADANGDGVPDVIVPISNSTTLDVYAGDGAGGFAAPVASSIPSDNIDGVAAGDIDGDGKTDIAMATTNNGVQICKGDGSGHFICAVYGPVAADAVERVALSDLTGDGKLDLVVTTHTWSGSGYESYVYAHNGAGTFVLKATLTTQDRPFGIAIGDINGDGKPDLVLGSWDWNAYAFIGAGDGSFGSGTALTVGASNNAGPSFLALADVNGDDKLDLVTANYSDSSIGVLLGHGDGSFDKPLLHATGDGVNTVSVADFDGDGQPDIAAVMSGDNNLVSSTVAVYLHNHAPAVSGLSLETKQDTAVTGKLAGSDPEKDTFTFAVATQPAHGKVSGFDAASGAFTYTPASGYSGTDSFTVTTTDTVNTSAPATVSIKVDAVTPPPDDNGNFGDTGGTTSHSSGGGGGFGLLGLSMLGLLALRRRIKN